MQLIDDYKWFTTNQTAGIPFNMAKRTYYTNQERNDAIALRPESKRSFLQIPKGDSIYREEIRRLLQKEADHGNP